MPNQFEKLVFAFNWKLQSVKQKFLHENCINNVEFPCRNILFRECSVRKVLLKSLQIIRKRNKCAIHIYKRNIWT